ncbi:MAG TPA: hypothetical protein VGM19_05785 [Armatimonadota bacterium]
MNRPLLPRLGLSCLFLAALALAGPPARADRAAALPLLEQARGQVEATQYDEARQSLQAALQADPTFLDALLYLGYLEELTGQADAAVAAYGRALLLAPTNQYARDHYHAIFYGPHFPRRIPVEQLPLSPVPLTLDAAHAEPASVLGGPNRTERLAYTTGLLFPDQMRSGGAVLSVPLPSAGVEAKQMANFNRVCYGFTAPAGSPDALLRVAVYYPSANLSAAGTDYAPLAVRLTHWMTRLCAYYELRLGTALPAEPIAVYLCEGGPTEAETYENAIYLYRLGTDRLPLEWMREAAHETGHRLLPQLGRFTAPEPWGSGFVGEGLAFQWLAAEAGVVAGTPWPAPEAQAKLAGVWSGPPLPLADYLARSCRPLLDAWTQTGPDSPLLRADTEATLSYVRGFLLWVQAAHDDALLAATLTGATGINPVDYVTSYQDQVKKRLTDPRAPGLILSAGALSLSPPTKLTKRPAEGALRRENVTLAPGDRAVWRLYLPAGSWRIQIVATPNADLTAQLDDQPAPLDADKHNQLTLTTPQPAWHTLTLTAGGTAPVTVNWLRIDAGKEA